MLLAFLVMVSMWAFQDSVLLKVKPRYLALFACFQLDVVDVVGCVDGFICVFVILISLHLSGLKCICQSASQSYSLLKSPCRDSASSSILMLRYTKQSSAKRRVGLQVDNVREEQEGPPLYPMARRR